MEIQTQAKGRPDGGTAFQADGAGRTHVAYLAMVPDFFLLICVLLPASQVGKYLIILSSIIDMLYIYDVRAKTPFLHRGRGNDRNITFFSVYYLCSLIHTHFSLIVSLL